MSKLNIKKSIIVNTSALKTWDIIGPNFLNISDWGPGLQKSWINDEAPKIFSDAPAGGRHCEATGFGIVDERILHYDAEKYAITWSAKAEKIPSFVSGLQNAINVEIIDENSCRASSNITADLKGLLGLLMGPVMKMNFNKVLSRFLSDWQVYAETGIVSTEKQKELNNEAV
jgi:hypothetical protein